MVAYTGSPDKTLATDGEFAPSGGNGGIGSYQKLAEITSADIAMGVLTGPIFLSLVAGLFQLGETVTGSISGATGIIQHVTPGLGSASLILTGVIGTFGVAETFTGGTSGVTGHYAGGAIPVTYNDQAFTWLVTGTKFIVVDAVVTNGTVDFSALKNNDFEIWTGLGRTGIYIMQGNNGLPGGSFLTPLTNPDIYINHLDGLSGGFFPQTKAQIGNTAFLTIGHGVISNVLLAHADFKLYGVRVA